MRPSSREQTKANPPGPSRRQAAGPAEGQDAAEWHRGASAGRQAGESHLLCGAPGPTGTLRSLYRGSGSDSVAGGGRVLGRAGAWGSPQGLEDAAVQLKQERLRPRREPQAGASATEFWESEWGRGTVGQDSQGVRSGLRLPGKGQAILGVTGAATGLRGLGVRFPEEPSCRTPLRAWRVAGCCLPSSFSQSPARPRWLKLCSSWCVQIKKLAS